MEHKNRNYLRVRGEYIMQSYSRKYYMELPPRTRRIPQPIVPVCALPGTTSAYAENTKVFHKPYNAYRNYLRVRGEYQ